MITQYSRDGRASVVLMADDDADDVALISDAFSAAPSPVVFRSVRDGYELIQYLHRVGPYADPVPDPEVMQWLHRLAPYSDPAPDPTLILLDLNMPRWNGMQVLAELKNTPHLCNIPIVVLTTSDAERDRTTTARLGANGYLTKPNTYDEFVRMAQMLQSYCTPEDEPRGD